MDRSDRTRVRCRRIGYGSYVGEIDVPLGDDTEARISVKAQGESKAEALHRAARLADQIVNDPLVQAVLPPQAKAAIQATKVLAAAGRQGLNKLGRLWHRLGHKNKQKLALMLAREIARREGHGPEAVEGITDWFKRAASIASRRRKQMANRMPPEPDVDQEPDVQEPPVEATITDIPNQGEEAEAAYAEPEE